MSFVFSPTRLQIPEVPEMQIFPQSGFWSGTGDDAKYVAFRTNPSFGGWVMTERTYAYSLLIGGRTAKPQYSDINGKIYWSGGGGHFYLSNTYGWVFCDQYPGYEPVETIVSETDEQTGRTIDRVEGDAFWTADRNPSPDRTIKLIPRGSMTPSKDDDDTNYDPDRLKANEKEVSVTFPRWVCSKSDGIGEYVGVDGASGTKSIGFPRWKDGNNKYYVRSEKKDKSGHYSYGDIHYANFRWLIGDYGSAEGWYEGSEPSKLESVTFIFKSPAYATLPPKAVIVVSFYDYILGDKKRKAYLGELALWR